MVIEKERLLNYLSSLFLSYRNPDEGYFRLFKVIKEIRDFDIDVDIKEVQAMAYNYEKENL